MYGDALWPHGRLLCLMELRRSKVRSACNSWTLCRVQFPNHFLSCNPSETKLGSWLCSQLGSPLLLLVLSHWLTLVSPAFLWSPGTAGVLYRRIIPTTIYLSSLFFFRAAQPTPPSTITCKGRGTSSTVLLQSRTGAPDNIASRKGAEKSFYSKLLFVSRTFHYIKGFTTARFSHCCRYLQPAGGETITDVRWEKVQIHKFNLHTSDWLWVQLQKKNRSQEEIWVALISRHECGDITFPTQLLFISL